MAAAENTTNSLSQNKDSEENNSPSLTGPSSANVSDDAVPVRRNPVLSDEEIQQYWKELPPELKAPFIDALVLYSDDDRYEAEKFRQHLLNEIEIPGGQKMQALLYDCPEFASLSSSKLQHLDMVVERSTYVFVYLTKSFVECKWCEISSESCLMKTIYDEEKRWCVIPVYTQTRSKSDFKIPMGLNSLKGIRYYDIDEPYRNGVAKLIRDKITVKDEMTKTLKIKQKEWIEKYKREQNQLNDQPDEEGFFVVYEREDMPSQPNSDQSLGSLSNQEYSNQGYSTDKCMDGPCSGYRGDVSGHTTAEAPETDVLGQITTDAPETNVSGKITTEAPETSKPKQINTKAPKTDVSGQITTEAPKTDESRQITTGALETVESEHNTTKATETVESGQNTTEAPETVESGQNTTEAPETVESGQNTTEAIETVELGRITTEASKTVESGQITTEASETVKSGQITTEASETVKSGQITTEASETVELGQIITEEAETVESGQITAEALETVKSEQITTEALETVESGQNTIEAPEKIESGQNTTEAPETVESEQNTTEAPETVESGQNITEASEAVESGQIITEAPITVESEQITTEAPETVELGQNTTEAPGTVESGQITTDTPETTLMPYNTTTAEIGRKVGTQGLSTFLMLAAALIVFLGRTR